LFYRFNHDKIKYGFGFYKIDLFTLLDHGNVRSLFKMNNVPGKNKMTISFDKK